MSIPCGSAIRHPLGSRGSLGCLVRQGGTDFILSNNHVLARINQASMGDFIQDANTGLNIATLSNFVRLNVGGPNSVDAAIAAVSVPGNVTPDIRGIVNVNPNPINAFVGQRVIMSGAGSGRVNKGRVTGLNSSVTLILPGNKVVQYVQQIQIDGNSGSSFSVGGDSGSLILDEASLRPVGLLVGADANFSYANDISLVLQTLNVAIV